MNNPKSGSFGALCLLVLIFISLSLGCSLPWRTSVSTKVKQKDDIQVAESLLKCSCKLKDFNGNGVLDAGESATMIVIIKNEGKGQAEDVRVEVSGFEGKGLSLAKEKYVGDIPPSQSRLAYFQIRVSSDVKDGMASFKINITEGNSNNPEPLKKLVRLKGYQPLKPSLRCSCQIKDFNGNGVLDAGESATMIIIIKNEGKGQAEDVRVEVSGFEGKGLSLAKEKYVGDIPHDQTKLVYFTIKVASDAKDCIFPIVIRMIEAGKYSPELLIEKAEVKGKSYEDLLYADVKKGNSTEACLWYISEFPQGRHLTEAKDILEDLRWKNAEKTYTITASKEYLRLYPKGKYAKLAYKRTKEVKAIAKTKKLDTYEAYKKFYKNYPGSRWVSIARKRATLRHWKQRLRRNPRNSHIKCQVAQALVEEEGEVAYGKAKKYYAQAIKMDGNNEQAYIGLAGILLDEQDYEAAKECLEQALSNGHSSYIIYYHLGRAYYGHYGRRRIREAISFYNKAIEQKPDFLECLYDRGILNRIALKFKEAEADFRRVIKIAPKSISARGAREYLKKMK